MGAPVDFFFFYFEFNKAFGLVNRKRLLTKLSHLGFIDHLLRCIKDFLTDHKLKVVIQSRAHLIILWISLVLYCRVQCMDSCFSLYLLA